jgi:two-component system, OmpR family, KDP operon response regulator KdpE
MVLRSDAAVLVVEPDPATRTCIEDCISASFGNRYRIVAVPTRQAGYDRLTTLRPQLLVMETDLPDGEGTWLIRSARSELSPSPAIIVCSHLRGVRDKIAAFEAGADDYVVKPLNTEQLTLRFQLLERFAALMTTRSLDPRS